jgi:hypothetical protein
MQREPDLARAQMSYNNYLDGDAAYSAVANVPGAACVVVKHTNPCGAAQNSDLLEAYRAAVRADPISAFGGIVAFNRCTRLLSPPFMPAHLCHLSRWGSIQGVSRAHGGGGRTLMHALGAGHSGVLVSASILPHMLG